MTIMSMTFKLAVIGPDKYMVYWLNIFHEVYSLSEILVGNRTLGECSKKTILAINDLEDFER